MHRRAAPLAELSAEQASDKRTGMRFRALSACCRAVPGEKPWVALGASWWNMDALANLCAR